MALLVFLQVFGGRLVGRDEKYVVEEQHHDENWEAEAQQGDQAQYDDIRDGKPWLRIIDYLEARYYRSPHTNDADVAE